MTTHQTKKPTHRQLITAMGSKARRLTLPRVQLFLGGAIQQAAILRLIRAQLSTYPNTFHGKELHQMCSFNYAILLAKSKYCSKENSELEQDRLMSALTCVSRTTKEALSCHLDVSGFTPLVNWVQAHNALPETDWQENHELVASVRIAWIDQLIKRLFAMRVAFGENPTQARETDERLGSIFASLYAVNVENIRL